MKNSQKEYWGSRKWKSLYGRRTFVEGFFGVLKGSSSTGLNRGSYRFVGLPMVTIMAASATAVSNMRLLRSLYEETGVGDITHELLKPDQPFYGFTQLDALQQAAMDRALGVEYTTVFAASAA